MKLLTLARALTLGSITKEVIKEPNVNKEVKSKKLEVVNCKIKDKTYTKLIFFGEIPY
jgi:hypothetical protein